MSRRHRCIRARRHPMRRSCALRCAIIQYPAACPRPATDGFSPCPPRLARNARTYQITLANGTTQIVTTSDPGRLLLTGQPADLGVMDVTNFAESAGRPPTSTTTPPRPSKRSSTTTTPSSGKSARLNPPPNLPPILSSDGLVIDRGFIGRRNGRRCWRTSESCRTPAQTPPPSQTAST